MTLCEALEEARSEMDGRCRAIRDRLRGALIDAGIEPKDTARLVAEEHAHHDQYIQQIVIPRIEAEIVTHFPELERQ